MLPQVAELGHLAAGDVIGDGNAGELDDAAFHGVHCRSREGQRFSRGGGGISSGDCGGNCGSITVV
jgi:hypothetical protein